MHPDFFRIGLYPKKGTIQPGSDADIVLYDPNATWTISVDNHHMNIDHSAYEGIEVTGHVDTVLQQGLEYLLHGLDGLALGEDHFGKTATPVPVQVDLGLAPGEREGVVVVSGPAEGARVAARTRELALAQVRGG